MFPVFSLVLDQDVKPEMAVLYPELYKDLTKVRPRSCAHSPATWVFQGRRRPSRCEVLSQPLQAASVPSSPLRDTSGGGTQQGSCVTGVVTQGAPRAPGTLVSGRPPAAPACWLTAAHVCVST